MAKITLEEYQALIEKGYNDKQITELKGIAQTYLPALKKKWFNDTEKPKLAVVEPEQATNTPDIKTAEYERLLQELKQQVETEKANAKNYRDQLLDTRHEFTQQSYTVENQRNVIENIQKTLDRYERENKALKTLAVLYLEAK